MRAKLQGLTWPLPESLDDAGLLQRLYPTPASSSRALPVPDWSKVHRELRRKGVTLALLWEEYKTVHPEGMQYSWFCARYRAWAAEGRRGDAPGAPCGREDGSSTTPGTRSGW